MPLLTVQTNLAGAVTRVSLICAVCRHEWDTTVGQWRVPRPGEDRSVLPAPSCPACGAAEFFVWHDATYVSRREWTNEDGVTVSWEEPDPSHFGARQMVLIARLGWTLGGAQANRGGGFYDQMPQAPSADEVRAYVDGL